MRVINQSLYISSDSMSVWFEENASDPALPYLRLNVLIPPDKEYRSVSYTNTSQLVSSQIQITTNPGVLPLGASYTVPSPTIIRPKLFYPDNNVVYDGTTYDSFYKIISFKVFPFKFFQLGQNLYLYTNISLNITLGDTEDIRYPSYYMIESRQEEVKNNVKASVINGNELEIMYADISYPSFVSPTPDDNTDYNYDYLIIAPKYFMFNGFDRLAQWKTTKGVKTKVLLLDSINAKYSGSTLQTRIKKAIKDYYVKSAGHLEYVLLAADVDKIPTLMCYGEVVANGDTIREYIPTDYYYSCLEDIDWDKNGNGIYGEIEDSVSLIPDVAISRIPLSRSEIDNYIDRLIQYEQNLDTTIWRKRILMCGSEANGRIPLDNTGFNCISDAHYKLDRIYELSVKDYWNGERVRYYDDFTDFSGGASFDVNAYNMASVLSDYFPIMFEYSHGDTIAWMLENSTYETSHVCDGNLPLILTAACHTNAFDASMNSLSESFLEKMSLAYIGCSRKSLDRAGIFDGPSLSYLYLILRYIFKNTGLSLGRNLQLVKKAYTPICNNYGGMRWVLFSLNMIGDTELSINVDEPRILDAVSIDYNNNQLNVYMIEDSCNVCLTAFSGNSLIRFELQKNTNHAIFNNLESNYSLCITKPGRIPFIKEININSYIQNSTHITDTTICSYNNTYIGSHVTTNKPEGSVTIQSGKTTIKNGNNVFINGVFEVEQGAELEIK